MSLIDDLKAAHNRATWDSPAAIAVTRKALPEIIAALEERDRLWAVTENVDERIRDILDVLTDFTGAKVDSGVKVRFAIDRLNALLPIGEAAHDALDAEEGREQHEPGCVRSQYWDAGEYDAPCTCDKGGV